MVCPKCDCRLKAVVVKDVELEICNSCHGIWFDFEELYKIIQIPQEDLMGTAIEKSLQKDYENASEDNGFRAICPKCKEPMEVQTYCCDSGVKMDKCRHCNGIWLDDGEIIQIIKYCKDNKPVPPENLLTLNDKLKEIETDWHMMEDKLCDDTMVNTNEFFEAAGTPGEILREIYRFFLKIGM